RWREAPDEGVPSPGFAKGGLANAKRRKSHLCRGAGEVIRALGTVAPQARRLCQPQPPSSAQMAPPVRSTGCAVAFEAPHREDGRGLHPLACRSEVRLEQLGEPLDGAIRSDRDGRVPAQAETV